MKASSIRLFVNFRLFFSPHFDPKMETLVAAVFPRLGYVQKDTTGVWSGMNIDILHYISELGNFDFHVVETFEVGNFSNSKSNWNETLELLNRGMANFSAVLWLYTGPRSDDVIFLQPSIMSLYVDMVVLRSETVSKLGRNFNPFLVFPSQVWALFGMLTVVMLGITVVSVFNRRGRIEWNTCVFNLEFLFRILVQQVDGAIDGEFVSNIVLGFWSLMALLLAAVYAGMVFSTSSLALGWQAPFRNLQEVAEKVGSGLIHAFFTFFALPQGYKIATFNDYAEFEEVQHFLHQHNPGQAQLFNSVRKHFARNRFSIDEIHLPELTNLLFRPLEYTVQTSDCRYRSVTIRIAYADGLSVPFPHQHAFLASFVVQKQNQPLAEKLNALLATAHQFGIIAANINRIQYKHNPKLFQLQNAKHRCAQQLRTTFRESHMEVITIDEMWLFLVICGACCAVGVVVLLIEVFVEFVGRGIRKKRFEYVNRELAESVEVLEKFYNRKAKLELFQALLEMVEVNNSGF